MRRRPPRSTRTDSFPTRRSSDLATNPNALPPQGPRDWWWSMSPQPRGHRDRLQERHPEFHPKRSEEHTSELQSLMRISYAVFCLKKKKNNPLTSIPQPVHLNYKHHHPPHKLTNTNHNLIL